MATAAKRSDFMGWYNKLTDWSVEDLFARQRAPGPPRSIFVNEPLPDDYYDKKHKVLKQHKYTTNQVITSKYTIITFLPRNLLEQFRRVANMCVQLFSSHALPLGFSLEMCARVGSNSGF